MITNDRLIRRSELRTLTGFSRYLSDLLEKEADFPQRIRVGRRAVFWSEAEVREYLEQLKQGRCVSVNPQDDAQRRVEDSAAVRGGVR